MCVIVLSSIEIKHTSNKPPTDDSEEKYKKNPVPLIWKEVKLEETLHTGNWAAKIIKDE